MARWYRVVVRVGVEWKSSPDEAQCNPRDLVPSHPKFLFILSRILAIPMVPVQLDEPLDEKNER